MMGGAALTLAGAFLTLLRGLYIWVRAESAVSKEGVRRIKGEYGTLAFTPRVPRAVWNIHPDATRRTLDRHCM